MGILRLCNAFLFTALVDLMLPAMCAAADADKTPHDEVELVIRREGSGVPRHESVCVIQDDGLLLLSVPKGLWLYQLEEGQMQRIRRAAQAFVNEPGPFWVGTQGFDGYSLSVEASTNAQLRSSHVFMCAPPKQIAELVREVTASLDTLELRQPTRQSEDPPPSAVVGALVDPDRRLIEILSATKVSPDVVENGDMATLGKLISDSPLPESTVGRAKDALERSQTGPGRALYRVYEAHRGELSDAQAARVLWMTVRGGDLGAATEYRDKLKRSISRDGHEDSLAYRSELVNRLQDLFGEDSSQIASLSVKAKLVPENAIAAWEWLERNTARLSYYRPERRYSLDGAAGKTFERRKAKDR